MSDLVPIERIESKILFIRGQKVLLDSDLAELYGVENKYLIRAVKRNIKRFPDDFMFQLDNKEVTILKRQFGTSSWGGRRTFPYAFTEQGVAMLSGVLNSDRAIWGPGSHLHFIGIRGRVRGHTSILLFNLQFEL